MSSLQVFPASYDRLTRILSLSVVATSAFVAILLVQQWWVAVLLLVSLGLAYAFSPTGYQVDGREIRVRRLIGDAVISLEDVRQARAAQPSDMRGAIRLFGNGGLFGYYGVYRTSALGVCRWYLTNRSKAVIVTASGRTTLFSPDDVSGFVAAIRAVSTVPDTLPIGFVSNVDDDSSRKGLMLGLGITAAAFALIAAVFLYSPGPPRYTLSHEALAIHDRFYPVTLQASAVDLDHVRPVDLSVDSQWRPTLRVNGFSNRHYHAGWYRVAGGTTIRMYRADSRKLVLLPAKGKDAPVLLEVDNPDTFIQELRKQWH